MRILKPEVAQERKNKILNWLIYRYITTGKPVSSKEIFESGLFNVSPATIRNILQELDNEGYLEQLHTSGGRIPTDKAYRFYIDNILKLQNLAENEKEKIEIEYERRISELDYFLKHTTKILSDLTKKIGFSMVGDISDEVIKRVDIVRVSKSNYIFLIVTDTGIIKHYPFYLETKNLNLRSIVPILNKKMKNLTVREAKHVILKDFVPGDETGVYKVIYEIIVKIVEKEDELFLEGLSSIYDDSDFSIDEIRSIARLLEEKDRFAKIIKEKFEESLNKIKAVEMRTTDKPTRHVIDVSIGSENKIKELNNFSLITSCYGKKDKAIGVIGVVGHKRMEYPRIISMVDMVSSMVEDILCEWEKEIDEL